MSQNKPVMSQREIFEHWFSDQGKWPQAIERSGEGYKLIQAQSAWETWKIACPEGWQAVPQYTSRDMEDALGCRSSFETREKWAQMLQAAPSPGEES